MARRISEIAVEIQANWFPVHFTAKPYLNAMLSLVSIRDRYGLDPAGDVIRYFLVNAQGWRGEVARRVKKELNGILKST